MELMQGMVRPMATREHTMSLKETGTKMLQANAALRLFPPPASSCPPFGPLLLSPH